MSDPASTSTDKGKEGEVSSSCDSSTATSVSVASNVPSETPATEELERERVEAADTSAEVPQLTVSAAAGTERCSEGEVISLVSTCESSGVLGAEECDDSISTTCEVKAASSGHSGPAGNASNSEGGDLLLRESSSPGQSVREVRDVISTSSADSTTAIVASTDQRPSGCQEIEISTTGDDSNRVSTSLPLNQCVRTEQIGVSNNSNGSLNCQSVQSAAPALSADVAESSGISTTSTVEVTVNVDESNNLSSGNSIGQSDSDTVDGTRLFRNVRDPVSSSKDVSKLVFHSLPSASSDKHEETNIDTTTHVSSHQVLDNSSVNDLVSSVGIVEKDESDINGFGNAESFGNLPACRANASQDVASSSTWENSDVLVTGSAVVSPDGSTEIQPSLTCEVSTSVDKQEGAESTTQVAGCKDSKSPSPSAAVHSPETSGRNSLAMPAAAETSSEAEHLGQSQLPSITSVPGPVDNVPDCEPSPNSDNTQSAGNPVMSRNELSLVNTSLSSSVVQAVTSKSDGSASESTSHPSSFTESDVDLNIVANSKSDKVRVDSSPGVVTINTIGLCSTPDKTNEELKVNDRTSEIYSPCEPQLVNRSIQICDSDGNNISVDVQSKSLKCSSVEKNLGADKLMSSVMLTAPADAELAISRPLLSGLADHTEHTLEIKVKDPIMKDSDTGDSSCDSTKHVSRKPDCVLVCDKLKESCSDSCDCISTSSKDKVAHDAASTGIVSVSAELMIDNAVQLSSSISKSEISIAKVQTEVAQGNLSQETSSSDEECVGTNLSDKTALEENTGSGPAVGNRKTANKTTEIPCRSRSEDKTVALNVTADESNKPVAFSKLIRPLTVNLTDISKLEKIDLGTGASISVKNLLDSPGSVVEGGKTFDMPVRKIVLNRLKSGKTVAVTGACEKKSEEAVSSPLQSKNVHEDTGDVLKLEGNKHVSISSKTRCQEANFGASAIKNQVEKQVSEQCTSEKTVPLESQGAEEVDEVSDQRLPVSVCASLTTKSDHIVMRVSQQKVESEVEKLPCSKPGKEKHESVVKGDSSCQPESCNESFIASEHDIDAPVCKDVTSLSFLASDIPAQLESSKEKQVTASKPASGNDSKNCKDVSKAGETEMDDDTRHESSEDKPVPAPQSFHDLQASTNVDKSALLETGDLGKGRPTNTLEATHNLQQRKGIKFTSVVTDNISLLPEHSLEKLVLASESPSNSQTCIDNDNSVSALTGDKVNLEMDKDKPRTELQVTTKDTNIRKDLGKSSLFVSLDSSSSRESNEENSEIVLKPTSETHVFMGVGKSESSVTEEGSFHPKISEEILLTSVEHKNETQNCEDVKKTESSLTDSSLLSKTNEEKPETAVKIRVESHVCKDVNKSKSSAANDTFHSQTSEKELVAVVKHKDDSLICKDVDVPKLSTVDSGDSLHHEMIEIQPVTVVEQTSELLVCEDIDKSKSSTVSSFHPKTIKETLVREGESMGESQICKDVDKPKSSTDGSIHLKTFKEKLVSEVVHVEDSQIDKDVCKSKSSSDGSVYPKTIKEKLVTRVEHKYDSQTPKDVDKPKSSTVSSFNPKTVKESLVTEGERKDYSQLSKDVDKSKSSTEGSLHPKTIKEKLVTKVEHMGDSQIREDVDEPKSSTDRSIQPKTIKEKLVPEVVYIEDSQRDKDVCKSKSSTDGSVRPKTIIEKLVTKVEHKDDSQTPGDVDKDKSSTEGSLHPKKIKEKLVTEVVDKGDSRKDVDKSESSTDGSVICKTIGKLVTEVKHTGDSQIGKDVEKPKSLTEGSVNSKTIKERLVTEVEHIGDSEISKDVDNFKLSTSDVSSVYLKAIKEKSATVVELFNVSEICEDNKFVSAVGGSPSNRESRKEYAVMAPKPSNDSSGYLGSDNENSEKVLEYVGVCKIGQGVNKSKSLISNCPTHSELGEEKPVKPDSDSESGSFSGVKSSGKSVKTVAVVPDQQPASPGTCTPDSEVVTQTGKAQSEISCREFIEEKRQSLSTTGQTNLDKNTDKAENPSLVAGSEKMVVGSSDPSVSREKLVEKITLKLKKDGSDSFIATQKKIKLASDNISDKNSEVEKESMNPEKITLKLKKDHSKSTSFIVSPSEKLTDTQADSTGTLSDKCPERITLKLKKHSSKSEQFVLSSSEVVSEGTHASKQTGEKSSICDEPAVEKITLKRMKDGSNSDVFVATPSKDVQILESADKAVKVVAEKLLQHVDKDGNKVTIDVTSESDEHSNVKCKTELKNEEIVPELSRKHSLLPEHDVDSSRDKLRPSLELDNAASIVHKHSSLLLPEVKLTEDKHNVESEAKVLSESVLEVDNTISSEFKSDLVAPKDVEKSTKQLQEEILKVDQAIKLSEDKEGLGIKRESCINDKSENTNERKQHSKKPELVTRQGNATEIKKVDIRELPRSESRIGEVGLKRKLDASDSTPVVVKKLKDADERAAPASTGVSIADATSSSASRSDVSAATSTLHAEKSSLQSAQNKTDAERLGNKTRSFGKDNDLGAASSSSSKTVAQTHLGTTPASEASLIAIEVLRPGKFTEDGTSVSKKVLLESKASSSSVKTDDACKESAKPSVGSSNNQTSKHGVKIEQKHFAGDISEHKVVCEKPSISKVGGSDTPAKSSNRKSEHVEHVQTKMTELSRSDESKPGKITLTLKKSAAWSVKQPGSQDVGAAVEGSEKASTAVADSDVMVLEEVYRGAGNGAAPAGRKRDVEHAHLAGSAPAIKKQRTEEKQKQSLNLQQQFEDGSSTRPKKIAEKRLFETLRGKEVDVKHAKLDLGKTAVSSTRTPSTSKVFSQETRPHKKEVPKPSVEDKLRQILSRMGTKVSSVFNNEVSITLTPPKSSVKAGPAVNLKFSDPCEIEVTPEVNILGSEVDVVAEGEDSNSQDIVILEEKIFQRKPPSLVNEESADSSLSKKSRGRPRKAEMERQRDIIPAASPAVLTTVPLRPKRMCRGREEKPQSQPKTKKPRATGAGRGRKKPADVSEPIVGAHSLPVEVKTETGLKPSTMAALLKTVSIVKIKPPVASQAVVSMPSHTPSVAQLSAAVSSSSRPAPVATSVPSAKPAPRTFSRVATPKGSTAHSRSTSSTAATKSKGVPGTATTIASTTTTVSLSVPTTIKTTTTNSIATTTSLTTAIPVVCTSSVVAAVVSDTDVCSEVTTSADTSTSPDTCSSMFTTAASSEVASIVTTTAPITSPSRAEVVTTAAVIPVASTVPGALPVSPCPAPHASSVQVFEEETRMSAESNSRSQTPARSLPVAATGEVVGEESQGSVVSTATTESNKNRKNRMEIPMDTDNIKEFTVDMIAEYLWPPDKNGEHLMVQEQISQYLGVKSFKRKYPDIRRRPVEAEEKTYLREKCLVSEYMSDLGLTAVYSSEILDIMYTDFQDKYEEYRRYMRDRQAKEFTSKQKAISAVTTGEKSKQDYKEKAVSSAAAWNSTFNRSRKEERRCSFDLQNFSIHYPQNRRANMTLKDLPKVGHYPISLIPGQYTDYYKRYTPTELRYFPLNTVLYGPMKPNERQEVKGSDGSQSDSDDSSSSDSSSSCSSEDTQDTDDSGSSVGEGERADSLGQPPTKTEGEGETSEGATCKVCQSGRGRNKDGRPEILIHCGQCGSSSHPTCLDLTLDMVPHIKRYSWQCTDCKTCCQCKDPADEDKMLFCDMCDRGYHIYCVGLRRVPSGRWHCKECAVCGSCGTQEPGGNNLEVPNAQWQYEYKKGDKGTRVYAQTLCVPCSKLWRKGRYCQLCCRCYVNKPDEEVGLINCSVCDKWMHAECCSVIGGKEVDRNSNFLCEICQEKGQARSTTIRVIPRSIIKV